MGSHVFSAPVPPLGVGVLSGGWGEEGLAGSWGVWESLDALDVPDLESPEVLFAQLPLFAAHKLAGENAIEEEYRSLILVQALTLDLRFLPWCLLLGEVLSVVSVSYPSSSNSRRSSSSPCSSELETSDISSREVSWDDDESS